ncbi:hypothetical protein HQ533_05385 [Candidatus Woesearchaeota archaeon]|nr:hypothetical protein [Candidatus Woesearchaeota archaeon]
MHIMPRNKITVLINNLTESYRHNNPIGKIKRANAELETVLENENLTTWAINPKVNDSFGIGVNLHLPRNDGTVMMKQIQNIQIKASEVAKNYDLESVVRAPETSGNSLCAYVLFKKPYKFN